MYSVFHLLIPKRFKSLRNKTENVRCKLLEKVALSYFVTIFLLKKLVFCCGNWRFRMNPLFFITMCSIDLVNSVQFHVTVHFFAPSRANRTFYPGSNFRCAANWCKPGALVYHGINHRRNILRYKRIKHRIVQ